MKKEAVMSWLRSHEQEQIEFLQQMIRIPSVTGNEGPIQEFMAKTLTEMGLAVDLFRLSRSCRSTLHMSRPRSPMRAVRMSSAR